MPARTALTSGSSHLATDLSIYTVVASTVPLHAARGRLRRVVGMLSVRLLLLMAGSVTLALTSAGCGVEVPSSPILSPVAGAGEVLDAARTAMAGVDSYRFTIDQTWENARATAVGSLDTSLTRLAIQGEWVSPDG